MTRRSTRALGALFAVLFLLPACGGDKENNAKGSLYVPTTLPEEVQQAQARSDLAAQVASQLGVLAANRIAEGDKTPVAGIFREVVRDTRFGDNIATRADGTQIVVSEKSGPVAITIYMCLVGEGIMTRPEVYDKPCAK